MRRNEKEITDISEIEAIIHNSLTCRIGMSDENIPYVVPMSFGYEDKTIYLHGAQEGMKTNILKKNPNICFEFDINTEILKAESPCHWGVKYRSVIGFGKAFFIDDIEQKKSALGIIMKQYSQKPFQLPDKAVKGTVVIQIKIDRMTGKESGFKQPGTP